MIVIDTGPHHDECAAVLEDLERPLVIPVNVVVETSYLVEHRLGPDAEARFLIELLEEDYRVEQLAAGDLRRMAELVRQYADMPLGTVDASVVAIAERLGIRDVATLDRRHFSVVRPTHVEAFTLVP